MNSKHLAKVTASGTARTAIIALISAIALTSTTGCFGSPRATDTFAGAAIGAGGGALIGGLGGGVVGYLVGTEQENRYYDGPRYYRGY